MWPGKMVDELGKVLHAIAPEEHGYVVHALPRVHPLRVFPGPYHPVEVAALADCELTDPSLIPAVLPCDAPLIADIGRPRYAGWEEYAQYLAHHAGWDVTLTRLAWTLLGPWHPEHIPEELLDYIPHWRWPLVTPSVDPPKCDLQGILRGLYE